MADIKGAQAYKRGNFLVILLVSDELTYYLSLIIPQDCGIVEPTQLTTGKGQGAPCANPQVNMRTTIIFANEQGNNLHKFGCLLLKC